jgi:hypothetical protein
MRTITKSLMAFAIIGFLMTSCGQSDVCGCLETRLAMEKEVFAAKDDKSKIEEINKKYEAKKEKCQELGKGKSKDELKKLREASEQCPANKELEKLRDERKKEREAKRAEKEKEYELEKKKMEEELEKKLKEIEKK